MRSQSKMQYKISKMQYKQRLRRFLQWLNELNDDSNNNNNNNNNNTIYYILYVFIRHNFHTFNQNRKKEGFLGLGLGEKREQYKKCNTNL